MVGTRPVHAIGGWRRGGRLVGLDQLRQLGRQVTIRWWREPPSPELSGVRRGGSDREVQAIVADPQAAVEPLLDDDRPPGPAPAIAPAGQGEVTARPADRVVPADPAWIVEAEDRLGAQAVGPAAPGRSRVSGRHGEPRVVPIEEVGQEGVGVVDRGDPLQAQLDDEPVLERPPQPLDPALRLGRAGADPGDLRLVEGTPDLGQAALAGELLGERRGAVLLDDEDLSGGRCRSRPATRTGRPSGRTW